MTSSTVSATRRTYTPASRNFSISLASLAYADHLRSLCPSPTFQEKVIVSWSKSPPLTRLPSSGLVIHRGVSITLNRLSKHPLGEVGVVVSKEGHEGAYHLLGRPRPVECTSDHLIVATLKLRLGHFAPSSA